MHGKRKRLNLKKIAKDYLLTILRYTGNDLSWFAMRNASCETILNHNFYCSCRSQLALSHVLLDDLSLFLFRPRISYMSWKCTLHDSWLCCNLLPVSGVDFASRYISEMTSITRTGMKTTLTGGTERVAPEIPIMDRGRHGDQLVSGIQ